MGGGIGVTADAVWQTPSLWIAGMITVLRVLRASWFCYRFSGIERGVVVVELMRKLLGHISAGICPAFGLFRGNLGGLYGVSDSPSSN